MMASAKTNGGRFFEDFRLGERIEHATTRTVSAEDAALYIGLTGSRFPLHCSDEFARRLGLPSAPIDDLLVFHLVFGRTVPDVSLNAVANLGYAERRFGAYVFSGDTLSASSTVIGLKESSNRQTGVVHVRSVGLNQRGETVLEYVRWVMICKRDPRSPVPNSTVPDLEPLVPVASIAAPPGLFMDGYDCRHAGSRWMWDAYEPGERIDHIEGMTIEESCHMTATRHYRNPARVHFNRRVEASGRFGRRLVYGGHVMSLARALSFNGLGNGFRVAAINAGRHAAPVFVGDTIYAWSEVVATWPLASPRLGAVRVRTVAVKDRSCGDSPGRSDGAEIDHAVVLDLDQVLLMPRRQACAAPTYGARLRD